MTTFEEKQKFYHVLGYAITQWQHTEDGLYMVFRRLLKCDDDLVASATFYSVMNFNIKLAMTNSAAQFALADSPQLEAWNKLHERMSKRADRRNELVHFTVLHIAAPDDKQPTIQLRPGVFDARSILRYKNKTMPKYDHKQLEEIRRSFGVLAQDVFTFATSLPWQPTLPKTDE